VPRGVATTSDEWQGHHPFKGDTMNNTVNVDLFFPRKLSDEEREAIEDMIDSASLIVLDMLKLTCIVHLSADRISEMIRKVQPEINDFFRNNNHVFLLALSTGDTNQVDILFQQAVWWSRDKTEEMLGVSRKAKNNG